MADENKRSVSGLSFSKWVKKQEARYKRGLVKNVVVQNKDESLKILKVAHKTKVAKTLAVIHPVFGPGYEKFIHINELNQLECDWRKLRDDWVKQRETWNELTVVDRFKNSVLRS